MMRERPFICPACKNKRWMRYYQGITIPWDLFVNKIDEGCPGWHIAAIPAIEVGL